MRISILEGEGIGKSLVKSRLESKSNDSRVGGEETQSIRPGCKNEDIM
jgi:hypothetical protein